VPVPPSGGVNGPDEIRRTALEQMPSVQLKFDSLTQAVEIPYYNVALLYLMQLEELASGGVRTPEPPFGNGELKTNPSGHEQAGVIDNDHPLFLPDSILSPLQPTHEALWTLPV